MCYKLALPFIPVGRLERHRHVLSKEFFHSLVFGEETEVQVNFALWFVHFPAKKIV